LKRKYSLFIKDILEDIIKIEEFVGNMSFKEFIQDDKTSSAVIRKLEIMGVAARNIPENIMKKYETLPWKDMVRMRDKISHGYFGVDYEIVWKVIKDKLTGIKPILIQIISDLKNEVTEKQ
jgi:uncharacterized protein with HEPN domain